MRDLLHVGVVGLGDIAHKAYLPVLAARDDVVLSLATRDDAVRARAARRYPARAVHREIDGLLSGAPLDAAFVHVATPAHEAVVAALLDARVPVLVDKPLAPSLSGATRLVELAEAKNVTLLVGFNRRYAPPYAALAERDRAVVIMSKHRVGLPDVPRRLVFDDLIHVVDTLRFLLPDGVADEVAAVRCAGSGGLLTTVTVVLGAGPVTAVGVMHRDSGSTEEVLEAVGTAYRTRVVDLADTWVAEADGQPRLLRRGDWTPVETQRGFTGLCERFLGAVRAGEVLSARDALRTHEVCEQVVAAAERAVV